MLVVTTASRTIQAFLLPFVRHYRAKGWEVDGLANGLQQQPELLMEFDHGFDIGWSRGLLGFHQWGRFMRQIRELVATRRYDVVHVHTPIASFVTRMALRKERKRWNTKVVYTSHGFHFHPLGGCLQNALFKGAERLAGRWTDKLVVINRDDFDAALKRKIVPRERLMYMPGIGLDPNVYNRSRFSDQECQKLRITLGLKHTDFALLVIAEFNPGKRHRDLIAAAALLGETRLKLVLAGEGPMLEVCREQARSLGLADHVLFLGIRTDIPLLLAVSDALALASEREGLPRSIMEAMAMGVPVIGADIRGTRDLIGNGCGVMVKVGDIRGYADAVRTVMDEPKLRETFALAASERIRNCFQDQILRLHDELYKSILPPS